MAESNEKVLIIIPAYNEEKNIGKVLQDIKALPVAQRLDILVMNDASTDNTKEVVKENRCLLVNHVFNLGYGSGLQVGYKYAMRHGYECVIQMDADGQHDVCNIESILRELETPDEDGKKPDIVLGSRFTRGFREYPTTALKIIAYTLFGFLIRLGTGKKITDPTTGLQGLSSRAVSFYAGYNHFDDMYPDANMIMQMLLLGYRVREIPAVMHLRTEGVSMHSGLKPIVYMFRMMFSIVSVWVREKLFHTDAEVEE